MCAKQRIHYIDIAKGIAIILVIIGHTSKFAPTNLVWWLYTFHMPLFFILSGMVFNVEKYKNFKDFFIAKVKSLLIPYFSLCLIGWFLTMIMDNPTGFLKVKTLNKFIGIFLARRRNEYYFSMWFITTLFVSENFLYIFIKAFKNKKIFLALIFIISAISGSAIIIFYNKGFYWNIDLVPITISFLLIGYFLRIYKEKFDFSLHKNIILMIILLAANLFTGYINYKNNGRSDLFYSTIGNPIYYYIAALCGSFATILFSKLLKKSRILEYIGRNSLIYYAYQKMFFITPLISIAKTLSKLGGIFTIKFVQLLIVVIGSCIGLAIVSRIITTSFPFLLGKFQEEQFIESIQKKRILFKSMLNRKEHK